MLFPPPIPVPTVRYVPGHDGRHPDIPPVAEVIAGGSVRVECAGADLPCGPIGVVGAEPGDLLMVEILDLGRADGRHVDAAHPGILGLAPSHAMLRDATADLAGARPCRGASASGTRARIAPYAARSRAACRSLRPRTQILLPVHVPGARISVGDLHFPERGTCGTGDGWIDIRVHLTKRGRDRFQVTEPVIMPVTTSSLDATVAGLTADVA